jgi:type II secretory pathway pseudopilin PulG
MPMKTRMPEGEVEGCGSNSPGGDGRPQPSCFDRSRTGEHRSRLLAGPHQQPRSCVRPSPTDRGYVLLTLLLMVAVMSIVAATAASTIAFTIRRDREEEMIHRGAEYSRAIRRFTKKMGRYPLSISDLENTNGLRFLRKRYKDPITGKDFKLLHMTDLQRIGVGGLSPAATVPAVPQAGPANAPSALNQSAITQGGLEQGNSTSSIGANTPPASAASDQQPAASQDDSASNSTTSGGNASAGSAATSNSSEPIGGGVIVGVASTSKRETIREFNHKNHYNDWLFFYDPAYDRGYPINGPTQLTMPAANLFPQQPGTQPPGTQPATTPQTPSTQSPAQ